MLRQVSLAAGVIDSVQAVPVAASAQMCGGVLSWWCFNSEPGSKSAPEGPSQEQMAGIRQYPTGKPRKAANLARNREFREAASIDWNSSCLSQEQARGGYPRYRVIGGRRCWYASARGRRNTKIEINVNPYDDPIWKQSDATGLELATTQLQECEEQALKLESEEKRTFLKQCMSNAVR